MPATSPSVSVVVPCYNEVGTIGSLIDSILGQSHALDDLEVIVADGMSDDGTRRVLAELAQSHPQLRLRVIDNPDRTIPAGLNRAIRAAGGRVIVRLDAHSQPRSDYIDRCLQTLARTRAANAGGVWEILPAKGSWIARSIAVAAAHPLGAGGARYRAGGREGEVETVPFGAYPREWLDRVGLYDESLLTNEDFELNHRLRRAGGIVWFDPGIRAAYVARPDLPALSRQYRRYGYWKGRMVRRNPESLRWRQILPAGFVAALGLTAAAALAAAPARLLLALEFGGYLALLLLSGIGSAVRRGDPALAVGLPLALATMHGSWGVSFWGGLLGRRPDVART
jgi:glycosyltransferase involved in cell wall biosynthesis